MKTRAIRMPERFDDINFPKAGIDLSLGFGKQPNRPAAGGVYARTCAIGQNVRAFEPSTNRARGGQRPGISKYIAQQLPGAFFSGGWVVQDLDYIVGKFPLTGGHMQLSQSGRIVALVAVSQGTVYVANPGDQVWTAAINDPSVLSPPLNFTGVIYSAANQQKLWFADGVNYCYYDPFLNTVFAWTAGTQDLQGNPITCVLPVDSNNNTPRLIATWRGRTVLSGLVKDPQNWFMSAVDDPRNFDYSPLSTTPTQAIAGNNAPAGLIGDVVTTLIPYTDDILVFGGDHTIYMMRGDPMAGGQIDLVSDAIGMAWGIPWCKDPYGNIYFVSNKTGIYTLVPGQQPQRISQPIEQLLVNIDTGANSIRPIWDDRFQGLHVFVSPLAQPGTTTHFFYELRSGAWWTDQFGSTNYDPIAMVTLDGNNPGDRVPLIGSWDGYVRAIDPAATLDDGLPISSQVMIGPILTQNLDDMLLKDVQCVLGAASGAVQYAIFVGDTAEHALSNAPVASGTWGVAGRNLTSNIRKAGHAIYIQLSSTNAWAMEQIRIRIASLGKVRMRGR